MKSFTFVIEHMEDEISGWPQIEYENMLRNVSSLVLSHLTQNVIKNKPKSLEKAVFTEQSVGDWPIEKQKRVLLLDPSSEHELSPEDADNFDFLLFGGILGDDPPQDRTKILRKMGFATRHLGPVQMTTDTAVLVAQQVLENQVRLSDIKFVDKPEIQLSKSSTVEMPFRYMIDDDGNPKLPPGLIEHIKAENDKPLF